MLAAMAAVVASCSKSERVAPVEGEIALELNGSVLKVEKDTKANDPLAENTQVGVFVDLAPEQSAEAVNALFKVNAQGQIQGDPILLTATKTYNVYAYAPYKDGITASTRSTIPVAHNEDVLYAYANLANVSTTNKTANLVFAHKVSQIAFTVVADESSPSIDVSNAALEVTGFIKDATMNVTTGKDGALTNGSVDNTIKVTDKNGGKTFFIPAAAEQSLSVKVTIGSTVYNATLAKTFEAGKSYAYTIKVKDSSTNLQIVGGVTPWVEVPAEDITAENK